MLVYEKGFGDKEPAFLLAQVSGDDFAAVIESGSEERVKSVFGLGGGYIEIADFGVASGEPFFSIHLLGLDGSRLSWIPLAVAADDGWLWAKGRYVLHKNIAGKPLGCERDPFLITEHPGGLTIERNGAVAHLMAIADFRGSGVKWLAALGRNRPT